MYIVILELLGKSEKETGREENTARFPPGEGGWMWDQRLIEFRCITGAVGEEH